MLLKLLYYFDYYDYVYVVLALLLGFGSQVLYVQVMTRLEWINHEL